MAMAPEDMSDDLHEARTMTEVGTKLDLARAYVDMGDPAGARSILEEVLDEGDEVQTPTGAAAAGFAAKLVSAKTDLHCA